MRLATKPQIAEREALRLRFYAASHSSTVAMFSALRLVASPVGAGVALSAALSATSAVASCEGTVALSKKEFTPLKVVGNEKIGKDVHKIKVAFPNPSDSLGMVCAGMLMVEGKKRDGSDFLARPYTPVTRDDTKGYMELVVKDYAEGNVSSHICATRPGEEIRVKGCFTKIKVEANKWGQVGMVAGGSGLTPCLQVVEELLSLENDATQITLIFCNKSEDDIFLKKELDALAEGSRGRFRVHYCVDAAASGWGGLTGFVSPEMVAKYLPPPAPTTKIMVCGPPPMYTSICGPKLFEAGKPPKQGPLSGILKDLGYDEGMVFKF